MSRLKESKRTYDEIPIPERLPDAVAAAVERAALQREKEAEAAAEESGKERENGTAVSGLERPRSDAGRKHRRRDSLRRWGKAVSGYGLGAAAVLAVAVTIGVNTSPVFAEEVKAIPVIGSIVRLFTAESRQAQEDGVGITIEVPGLEAIREDTGHLAEAVSQEIKARCDDYAEAALNRAKEYKKAFLDTGGTEEQWKEHDIQIRVWYELKSESDRYVSFAVTGTENWISAYSEYHYYNLDLDNLSELSLEDLLGPDYIETVNECVRDGIKEREQNSGDTFFTQEQGGFQTITDKTPFYINEKGNPVVVFEKYEIAPGAMGRPEFEIVEKEEKVEAEESAGESASAGLDNFSAEKEVVEAFAVRIKDAVADGDMEALADCTAYPVYIGFPEGGRVVATREEFLALGKEKIMTDQLKESMAHTDTAALKASMAGFFMQGSSEEKTASITFGIHDGKLGISGINY